MSFDQEALAARLVNARRPPFARLNVPAESETPPDLSTAYAVSERVAAALGPVGGWKIGATARRAQSMLNLKEPFWGPILSADIHLGSAVLPGGEGPFEVEPEIVFELARPLDHIVDLETVKDSVAAAFIGLEVNRPSYADPFAAGAYAIIADKGVNRALVVGPEVPDWRRVDLAALPLVLRVDAAECAGDAASSGFDPWEALAWLAAARLRHGAPLAAGAFVATGLIAGSLRLPAGGLAVVEGAGGTVRAHAAP